MGNWHELTERCHEAMAAAADQPGRYGGRYVGRYYDSKAKRNVFVMLDDDDPETVPEAIDVLAQVTPKKVLAIGYARNYLGEDGSVSFGESG